MKLCQTPWWEGSGLILNRFGFFNVHLNSSTREFFASPLPNLNAAAGFESRTRDLALSSETTKPHSPPADDVIE